ncbi:MAG: MBOAT family O-acyltransferase, partial [Cyanobacteria bacterium P01_G01_bin.38]
YLYIPLGGNRGGHTYRNLMLTMLLGGLWHGAAWTFVIWGGMHGGALIAHREWAKRFKPTSPWLTKTMGLWGAGLTFYWVCFTWIFFRADSFANAMTVVKAFVLLQSPGAQQLNLAFFGVFALLAALHWVWANPRWKTGLMQLPDQLFAVGYGFAIAALLTIMPTSYSPFIYFQF